MLSVIFIICLFCNMCISPISIVNKTKKFVDLTHRLSIDVPCGHCDSCRERYIDDWQVRVFSEMEHYKQIGGKTIFITLTYKPSCRPFFVDDSVDLYGNPYSYKIPCFSKRDVHRFIRSFTRAFYRSFTPMDVRQKDLGVKFFCASEYGKDPEGQRCPHYHMCIHLPPSTANNTQLENLCNRLWTAPLLKEHPLRGIDCFHYDLNGNIILDKYGNPKIYKKVRQSLGFVLISDKGIEVNSSFACSYCAKYACKDVSFFEHPEISKYLDKKNPAYQAHKERIKDYLPKHWQSTHYGSSLLDTLGLDFNNAMANGFHIPNQPLKTFSLPRYIVEKEIYFTAPDGRRFLNDKGMNFFAQYFDKRIDQMSFNFLKYSSPLTLQQLSHEQIMSFPLPRFSSLGRGVLDLSAFLRKKLKDRYKDLALYNVVWKNRVSLDPELFDCVDELQYDHFVQLSKQFYLNDLSVRPDTYPLNIDVDETLHPDSDEYRLFNSRKFNQCRRFKDFDYCLTALTYVASCLQSNKLKKILSDRHEREISKYLLKHSKFKVQ